jgi:hypothetical protein
MRALAHFLFLLCLLMPISAGTAQEVTNPTATMQAQVDGMLFFATDEAVPTATEEAKADEKAVGVETLKDLRTRLGKSFPQKNFQLMGKHTQMVFKDYESWVVPSKEICLKIDSRGPAESTGINLHLQLWQDKKVLVKSDATLKPNQPIFIGGPNWRKGRLIFVVMLKK